MEVNVSKRLRYHLKWTVLQDDSKAVTYLLTYQHDISQVYQGQQKCQAVWPSCSRISSIKITGKLQVTKQPHVRHRYLSLASRHR